jgi:hypothetical protein
MGSLVVIFRLNSFTVSPDSQGITGRLQKKIMLKFGTLFVIPLIVLFRLD